MDRDALNRLRRVWRHLIVGLVDQAVRVRLLCEDPQIEALALGPVQTLVHPPLIWPTGKRRIADVIEALAQKPPTIAHAFSQKSLLLARSIADAFDAELVYTVTSQADCEKISATDLRRINQFIAYTDPIVTLLEKEVGVETGRIELIRPGIKTADRIACFSNTDRLPTILCSTQLERHNHVERLLQAARMVISRGHEVLVFLIGGGSQETALRKITQLPELRSRVTFSRPIGDWAQAMSGADIFVQPFSETAVRVEGLQAMGQGMAVIAFPSTVVDYFRHEETALVCANPTAESCAHAIERFVADYDFAKRIATGGQAYVRTHHAMSAMADQTVALYRKLTLPRTTFPLKA